MTLRGLETHDIAEPSGFDPGPAPQLHWIDVGDLVIDDSYQRDMRKAGKRNVAHIVEAFAWSKFAPLIVSPVEGGLFAIVDGQHRATAAKICGVKSLPAQVILANGREQAAAFKAVNNATTRMHTLEIHRAAVAAGDRGAMSIEAACARAGVSISKYPTPAMRMKPGETGAIGAVRTALARYADSSVILALECVTRTSNNLPGVLNADTVEALCAVVEARRDLRGRAGELIAAFDKIIIIREHDKARFTERGKGTPTWHILRDRLLMRLDEQLARARKAANA